MLLEKKSTPPPSPPNPDLIKENLGSAGKTRVRLGMTSKMLILLLAVSLVPLGVLWGIDFRNTTNRIQRDTELLMAETASGLGKQVDEWVDKNMRILKLAAKMPEIRSMDRSRQETVLRSIHEEYPWMYLVFTLDSTGMNLSRNDGKALRDYSDRQYYKDVTAGKTVAWQTLIGKTSHKPALVIATPIKEYGETVGVMAAAMTINDITDKVAGWKQGQTGFAFLVDENNTVVVHPNSQYVLERKDISKHPLLATFRETGEPLTKIFQEQESEVRALGHMVGLNHEWALAIQQQDSEVFAALRKDKISALILLVSTILVVVVLSVLASRAIVNPIKHLTDVAERMSLGDLEAKINVRSKDEIGQLAMALSRMQYSLSLAMSRFRKRS